MKTELRQEYLLKRWKEEDAGLKSRTIMQKLFSLDSYRNAGTVMFYCAFNGEVETDEMIGYALKEKRVLVPRMKDGRTMEAVMITGTRGLVENKAGIKEPRQGSITSEEKIDLVVIPAVAFDFAGHRIGYGYGCYDKFLEGFEGVKIGIAYDSQLLEKIPSESHDIAIDIVITEKRLIKYGNSEAI